MGNALAVSFVREGASGIPPGNIIARVAVEARGSRSITICADVMNAAQIEKAATMNSAASN